MAFLFAEHRPPFSAFDFGNPAMGPIEPAHRVPQVTEKKVPGEFRFGGRRFHAELVYLPGDISPMVRIRPDAGEHLPILKYHRRRIRGLLVLRSRFVRRRKAV